MEISVIQSSDQEEILETINEKSVWWNRLKENLLPSKKSVNHCITQSLAIFLLSSASFGILNERALPGSETFALFLLMISSFLFGKILGLATIPPFVGMLMTGFVFRNSNLVTYYNHISKESSLALRGISFCYIVMRAGTELDGSSLKKMSSVIVFLPCLAEAVTMGLFAHYVLCLPWVYSWMLGFAISSASPAAAIGARNEGAQQDVPIFLISSLENIFAISGFTLCFSMTQGQLPWIAIKGPLEPAVGLAVGAVLGIIFWHFPCKNTPKVVMIYYNVLLVSLGSISAIFLSKRFGIPGAGTFACFALAFVASMKWRKDPEQLKSIYSCMDAIWLLLEPSLFSLTGVEVTAKQLTNNAGFVILAIVSALLSRMVVVGVILYGTSFTVKRKLYICISWFPKATVQAAVGLQVLDFALSNGTEEVVKYGSLILITSVLSIVLTAPLGGILLRILETFTKEDQHNTEGGISIIRSSEEKNCT